MAFLLEDLRPSPALESSRRKLVLSVLEEYHGPIVATVADVMMRTERTTLPELTRMLQRDQEMVGISRVGQSKVKVTPKNVRESLLILVQHNMVSATMPTEKELRSARSGPGGGAMNVRLHYSILPLAVLRRSRGPHFHFHAAQKFGKTAGMIVDCFIRHGRRTLPEVKEELLERAKFASSRAVAGDDGMSQDLTEEITAESIQNTFQELVVGRYMDKVPKPDLSTPSREPEQARKASLTFSKVEASKKSSSAENGTSGSGAKDSGNSSNHSVKKGRVAPTNSRKRRIIGHDPKAGGAGGPQAGDSDDEEDELPIELQGIADSLGGMRPPATKRMKRSSENGGGSTVDSKSYKATGRTRGRGRSRGRGGRGGADSKRKGKGKSGGGDGGLDMESVFQEEGSTEEDEDLGALWGKKGAPRVAGAGATVLDGVVWKLGVDKFHRDFRHTALLGLVQDRFPKSKVAYLAVKVILENSAPTERAVDEEVTAAMSAKEIFKKVCDAWRTNALTKNKVVPDWKRFISWMAALCSDITNMVSKVPGSDLQDPRYVVNMANMVRYMRSRLVKYTLKDKYGKETARVMEILLQHKFLDQQQVGDMAMVPPSDARERLYCLLKDRLVSMQEVPKRADYNPSSTFYLWTVKHDQVAQVVLDSLYKAMLNMRLRRKFVYSNDKELFIHDAASRVSNEGERGRLELVRRTLDRLDTALLRLDEHLMFFNTF